MPEGLTVKELCATVERAISDAFPSEVWVKGAISGLSRSSNGHVYFDLIDPGELGQSTAATLPVALFASSRHRVNAILRKTKAVRMTDGVEIQIRGAVAYYARQGRVQLIMSLIDPAFTLGQIEEAKALLLTQLRAEGLIDANKKLSIPLLPLRVGLITSSGSAAEADFVQQLRASGYPFEITLFDARVQGDEAPASLRSALDAASSMGPEELDVIALVRGGGARTDLVAFDHADVARGIVRSTVPVMVGVGHETDDSVADDVAHSSAKTPTACAALLVDAVAAFDYRVGNAGRRIAAATSHHLARADLRLSEFRARLARTSLETVAIQGARLDTLTSRLSASSDRVIERSGHALDRHEIRIRALDPARALARGWSITHTETGRLVTAPTDVAIGDQLVTTVAAGRIHSVVTDHSPEDPDAGVTR